MRRVAITGMGVISPIGNNLETFWNNAVAGVNGIATITKFDVSNGFPVTFAGEVKGFNAADFGVDPKTARRCALFTQYALAASKMAVADSGIDFAAEPDPYRFGCTIGSGVGGIDVTENEVLRMERGKTAKISPFSIPEMIANMAAGMVALQHGLRGLNYGVVSACATGLHSVGAAMRAIQHGEADVVLAGGCEAPICPVAVAGFAALHALSTRNDDPGRASRPFDKGRDGFVMAEGAAVLVLEDLDRAKKRGARIYAEVAGFGQTCDAYHMTAPMPSGEAGARAMSLAMAEAGVSGEDVDYVNAHGTSTPMNDKTETAVIKQALGESAARKVSVSSTKSMTGHLLGGTGALETVVCAKAIETGIVPPTINYETPDPECDLDCTPNVARERPVKVALNNSLGFGGHNAVVALKAV
ncbi:MAG: beta-ketoacyl-ACP synthase II [Kiritimatiellae bacterium]|nr:beta-ketoacyl-ACP synthase II [Kiritimatiellia bacterium]